MTPDAKAPRAIMTMRKMTSMLIVVAVESYSYGWLE
jgi:hypothetical protein